MHRGGVEPFRQALIDALRGVFLPIARRRTRSPAAGAIRRRVIARVSPIRYWLVRVGVLADRDADLAARAALLGLADVVETYGVPAVLRAGAGLERGAGVNLTATEVVPFNGKVTIADDSPRLSPARWRAVLRGDRAHIRRAGCWRVRAAAAVATAVTAATLAVSLPLAFALPLAVPLAPRLAGLSAECGGCHRCRGDTSERAQRLPPGTRRRQCERELIDLVLASSRNNYLRPLFYNWKY